jgi:hypothetical protein
MSKTIRNNQIEKRINKFLKKKSRKYPELILEDIYTARWEQYELTY